MRPEIDLIEREINLEELNEMEDLVPMTRPDRNRLRLWVYSGHSVDENPWGYRDERGYLLNYLDALHHRNEEIWGEYYRPFYLVIRNT